MLMDCRTKKLVPESSRYKPVQGKVQTAKPTVPMVISIILLNLYICTVFQCVVTREHFSLICDICCANRYKCTRNEAKLCGSKLKRLYIDI